MNTTSPITEIKRYDPSRQSELLRFARMDAGCTVIDVYPGDGDWTRLFPRRFCHSCSSVGT